MLKFGTGGVPWSSKKRDTTSGIMMANQLGLDHLELEFVQGVRMKEDKAREVGALVKQINVQRSSLGKADFELTIHGPYYVNLISTEPKIINSSKEHILNSLRIGSLMNAKSVTFHAGFIQTNTREVAMGRVIEQMNEIKSVMEKESISVIIAPELTGKESQFGDLKELVSVCKEIQGVKLCYDFAHSYARSIGKNNTEDEIRASIKYIVNELGSGFLRNMHIHMSNIVYSSKGERWHLPFLASIDEYREKLEMEPNSLEILNKIYNEFYEGGKKVYENIFDWQLILRICKEFDIDGWVVCESPILEWDALLLQKYYNKL